MQPRGVALDDGALAGELELDRRGLHALEQAEVQERDAAVVQQQEVPGMRIAGELPVAVQAAEEEAEDDLADPVALGLRAAPSAPRSRRRCTNSLTITRSRESEPMTSGTKMNGCPAKMRASERWFCASSS